jgi:hypothetical protein
MKFGSLILIAFPFNAQINSRKMESGRETESERQRGRETEMQRDREAERQRDRETERQIGRKAETQRDRETEKQEIEPGQEKPKMLDYFKINCICSSFGEPDF